MHKENDPGKVGLRAAVTAMFKTAWRKLCCGACTSKAVVLVLLGDRPFRLELGKNLQRLALAAEIAAVAALLPTTGAWHPVAGLMLLVLGVVLYLYGSYLVFRDGGDQ